MCGAKHFKTTMRVTLPMVAPALAGAATLGIIQYLENFDVEAFLGTPAGIYVISTEIYNSIFVTLPAKYNAAMSLSVILLIAITILVVIQWKTLITKQHKFASITGRGYTVRPIDLGRWKYLTFAILIGYFFFTTLLPGVVGLLGPFTKYAGLLMGDWFTLEHVKLILGNPQTWQYFRNTALLAIFSATGGVFFYVVISYVIVRTKYAGRGLMEFMTWVPYFMPGIVAALALLWVFVGTIKLPFPMYGTIQLLALCMIIKRMPLGIRTMNSVVIQVGKELEEASRVHGASWWRTFKNIILPLLRPGMVSVWLLLAVFASKDLVIALMLYGARSKTLSVQMWSLTMGGQGGTDSQALVVGLLEMVLIIIFWLIAFLFSRRKTLEGTGGF
jgi:iron(III) transport system permease protein